MNQSKRTTIEDAIRAANLEGYNYSKKEGESQTQPASKFSTKSPANKASNDNGSSWQGLGAYSSSLNFATGNTAEASKKSAPKDNNSISALLALFKKDIDEIEHEDEKVPAKNQDQSADININALEKKKKKTRWEKPISLPQMPNTNLLENPQGIYNTNPLAGNFGQQPQGFYQSSGNVPVNNNLPLQTSNYGGGTFVNRFSTTAQPSTYGGFGNTAYGSNVSNRGVQPSQNPTEQQRTKSIENYTVRAFERCRGDKERLLTEKALKKIFNNAKLRGDYYTRDWDAFPLPTIGGFTYGSNQEEEAEGASEGPITFGSLLAKRDFKQMAPEDSTLQIGVDAKGKKVIKTQNKAAHKAKVMELTKEEEDRRKQRQGRFQEDLLKRLEYKVDIKANKFSTDIDTTGGEEGDYDLETLAEKWKVVGTSTAIEKPYLRLTKEPDPSLVRPEHILKKSLKMVLEKWKNKEAPYNYIAEQFRSIRQDLTVQHIKNEFTMKVYESNARISLESHDVKYFNQCQSWLKDLYASGIPSKNKPEFFSYRILHLTLVGTKNDVNQLLQELTDEELSHEYVKFALDLRRHMENGNVKGVFNMYKNGVNLTSYLLDIFIHRVRIWALQIITKGFGEKTPLSYLTDLLAFNNVEDLKEFIKKTDGVMNEEEDNLLNKESYKIYHDHPWMKMKLQILKAAHG